MKLLAPIAVIIAAASARQIYTSQSAENYANSAEAYQSALEQQQNGLYSSQSQGHGGYETESNRPAGEKTARILAFHNENDGHRYRYAYETENGIKAEEVGETHEKGTVAQGAYSYKGDDGQVYSVSYVADENGFRPTGSHLPTPPPVPEEILKSLEQNAHDEAAGVFDDGKYHEQQELGHNQQQYESGHQPINVQGSGYSGADLAYHAQAPAAHSGARLIQSSGHKASSGHQAQAASGYGSTNGHQGTSAVSGGHSNYFVPSSHSGSSLGHQVSSGHGASLGHQASLGHATSYSQQSSVGHGASSNYQAPQNHGARLVYQSSTGHGGSSGHQSSLDKIANLAQQAFSHASSNNHQGNEVNLQSGFQTTGYSGVSQGYGAPTSFSMPSTHEGISGFAGGSRYLPPSGQAAASSW